MCNWLTYHFAQGVAENFRGRGVHQQYAAVGANGKNTVDRCLRNETMLLLHLAAGPVCSQLGGNDEVDGYGGCNKSGEAWIYGMLDSEVKMRRKEEIIEARNGEAGRQKACAFPSEKTTNDDRQMKTRGGYPCNPGENFRTDAYGQGKRIPLGVRGTHLWKIQTPYLLPDTTEKVKRPIALIPTPRDVAQNS